jgi:hypothetical protein
VRNICVKDGKGNGALIICTLANYVEQTYVLLWALSVEKRELT